MRAGGRTYAFRRVRRVREATTAYCPDCRLVLGGNAFWGFRKSVGLHARGMGHTPWLLAPDFPESTS